MAIFREIKEGTRKGGERDTSDVESKWTVRHWVAKRKKGREEGELCTTLWTVTVR